MRNPLRRFTLHSDEQILTATRASMVLPVITYVFLLATLLGLYALIEHRAYLFATLIMLAITIIHSIHRHQYIWVITTHRTIAQRGILNIHSITVSHDRITDTAATAPLLVSAFGTGKVKISTAGNDDIQITIWAQHEPHKVSHLLHNLKRQSQPATTALTGGVI